MRVLDVGVVGCGTAGAAAAALLAREGHRVRLFERVADPSPVGAGIILQPTGLAVLASLGVAGRVVARGRALAGLHVRTPRDFTVVDLRYAQLGSGCFGLGIHRGVLFEALRDAATDAGADLRLGVPIAEVAREGEKRVLVGEDGARHGPFDLVAVADGARSHLRPRGAPTRRVSEYPWGALWIVTRDERDVIGDVLRQTVEGTRRLLGYLPTGLGPTGDVPLVSVFWSVRLGAADALRAEGLDAWKREVLRLDARGDALVAQAGRMDELLLASYHDVVMRPWHDGALVYVGDCAHAMSPQLGQGANLALMDAATLAACIASAEAPAEACARYSQDRRTHLGFYQFASRWLTPLFQSDHGWLAPLRDLGMGLGWRIPFVRTQMTRSMAGLKRGIVRRSLPAPAAVPRALPG